MTDERTTTQRCDELSRNSFHLLRYFLLISVAAIVTIALLSGLGLRSVLSSFVIKEAEDDAVHVSAALRDCEVKEYIPTTPGGRAGLVIPSEEIPELDRNMRVFLAPFDIVKIKVFDLDTRIIYSTDPKIIGKLNPDNSKLAAALRGEVVSKFETKEHVWDLDAENRPDVGVVETYVPVTDKHGRIVGSFEVYKDVTPYLRSAKATLVQSLGILFVVLLVVFGLLSGLMRRAARLMDESRRELRAFNDKLEQCVAERTEELQKTVTDLERFNRLGVGREHRMIELKRQVNEMAGKAGVTPPYNLSFTGVNEEGADDPGEPSGAESASPGRRSAGGQSVVGQSRHS